MNTGLTDGTNYYYKVAAFNFWGESSNPAPVSVTPGSNFTVHFEGDPTVNLQSQDLNADSNVWTNRTSNAQSAGYFTKPGSGNLNVVNLSWYGQPAKTLFVNSMDANSV
jgi:hypothetical protein